MKFLNAFLLFLLFFSSLFSFDTFALLNYRTNNLYFSIDDAINSSLSGDSFLIGFVNDSNSFVVNDNYNIIKNYINVDGSYICINEYLDKIVFDNPLKDLILNLYLFFDLSNRRVLDNIVCEVIRK